jgi:hypothetical protein
MKKYLQLFIGLAIACGAVWYTLRNVSATELMQSLKQVHYGYLAATLPFILGSYVGRAYRWQALLGPIKAIPVKNIYSPLMIGFMGNILPARFGEFLRAILISRQQDFSFSAAFATIVVERLFDLIMVLLLFAVVMVFYADAFNNIAWSGISVQSMAYKFGWMAFAFIIGLAVFIYMLVVYKDTAMRIAQWCVRILPHRFAEKILHLLGTFSEGLQVAKNPAALLKITFHTLWTWALIVLSYYPFFLAYDLQNSSMQALLITTLMVCIFITLLPTPAFLGSFQAGIMVALHEILHEPEITVASLGMVSWALNFSVILIMGVYCLLHDHLSVGNLLKAEAEAEHILKKED